MDMDSSPLVWAQSTLDTNMDWSMDPALRAAMGVEEVAAAGAEVDVVSLFASTLATQH